MKILYITNMYPVADYTYFGIHVKEQIEAIEQEKGISKEVYFINGRADKFNYFKSISEIKKLIKNGAFDLIHIHYGISGLFLLFYKPPIPVVITLHSGELYQKKGYINHILQKNITLAIVKKVQKVIVLNDDMILLLNKYRDKLFKMPCGTDLSYFKESSESNSGSKFVIGFPGNKARKEKNYSLFKEIVDQLSKHREIEVIEFHNLTREEVVLNLNKIDLLLMTSLVEGSPQIIKEAMACNTPIVSTLVGDIDYLLKEVQNCFVVNSFNAADFKEPVMEIINLPLAQRKTNGRAQLIKLGLDAKSIARSIYHLYEQLT